MEFRGTETPKLYLISYYNDVNYPFSDKRGNFLSSLLGEYNLILDSRFANIKIQTKESVFEDIKSHNPELIAIFGDESIKDILQSGDSALELSGNLFTINIDDKEYKLIVLEDLDYVLEGDENIQLKFKKNFQRITKILNGTYVDVLKTKEILNAHSFDEFKEICDTRFKYDTELAYDIETNARPPMTVDSKIIGFSLANNHSGVYVSLDSLDFHMSKEEEDKIWDYTINEIFDKKEKLIIHNTMYERPYTLFCKDYEITFEKAHDTLVMARMLREPKISAGLKYQAQTILDYPDWETPLIKFKNLFLRVLDKYGLGAKKFDEIKHEFLNGTNLFEITLTNAYNKLKDTDKEELYQTLNDFYRLLLKFYTQNGIIKIGKEITNKLIICIKNGGIQDSTIPYNWIPDKILSEYGAVDSLSTFDLKEHFFNIMKENSTDKVDLFKGYNLWMQHMYVAYIMERNGLYWNEDRVVQDKQFLENQANNCLYNLLKSPCFEPYIYELCESRYRPQLMSDYYPHIAFMQGYAVAYNKQTKTFSVSKDGKKTAQSAISNIVIPENILEEYKSVVKQLFFDEVEELKNNWEELKKLYNPLSTDGSKVAIKIFMIPDLVMGARMVKLHTLANSPSFEEKKNTLTGIDKKILNVADLCCNESKLKSMYGDTWAKSRRELFEGFCNLYTYRRSVTSSEIKAILNEVNPIEIDTVDDDGIIAVYDNLVVTGIDQDDKSTYTPIFDWMINYRLFKKSAKILTTYIEGSVGHEAVYAVNKADLDDNKHKLGRIHLYNPNIPLKSNEFYLLATSWRPNVADTGRWTSPQHTIPSGSQVKKYYTSRFSGGTMLMPDYCLTGDTKIRLLDGRQISLEELYNNNETDFEVYSYDTSNKAVVPGKAHNLHITKNTNEIYEIVLDNGYSIKCTGNHPFLTWNNEYVRADELKIGTSLRPCNFRLSNDRILKGYEELESGDNDWKYTHHIVYDSIHEAPKKKSQQYRHHINGNKLDNRIDNLELVSASEHMSHHMKEYFSCAENKQSFGEIISNALLKPETKEKLSNNTKNQWETNKEYREKMHEVCTTVCADNLRKITEKTNKDPYYIEKRKVGRDTISKKEIEEALFKLVISGVLVSPSTWNMKLEEYGLLVKGCIGNSLKNINRVFGDFSSFINSMSHLLPKPYIDEVNFRIYFENKLGKGRSLTYKTYYNNFETLGMYVAENTWNTCLAFLSDVHTPDGFHIVDKYHLPTMKTLYKHGLTFDELKRYCRNNHRIIDIIVHHLDNEIPVYDLEVDTYHNFLVCTGENSGVFVHNSQAEVRTLAAISHDEDMLDVFRSGKDFHTETAKKIFRKDEVTPAERRFSKGATFSLLYGSSVKSFAESYCEGDMSYAQSVFDGFFNAYPKVREWVEERHKEVEKSQRVSLEISGRFIQLPIPPDATRGVIGRILRQAQNFPIQSFEYNTEVVGLDGNTYKIGDIANSDTHELWTLACDPKTFEIVPVKGIYAQQTGMTDCWYEIVLDNNESVKVTPDHLMMLRDGTFKRADELSIGQSLMPYNYTDVMKDYIWAYNNDKDRTLCKIHKKVYSLYGIQPVLKGEYHIHHIDLNTKNNCPDNLIKIRKGKHEYYHSLLRKCVFENDYSKLNDFIVNEIRYCYSSEDSDILITRVLNFHKSLETNLDLRNKLFKASISYKNSIRTEAYPEWSNNQSNIVSKEVMDRYKKYGSVLGNKTHKELSDISKNNWNNYRDKIIQKLNEGHNTETAIKNHSDASVKRESNPDYIFNRVKRQLAEYYEKGLDYSTPNAWDINSKLITSISKMAVRKSTTILKVMSWEEFLGRANNYLKYHNHKIIAINKINLETPEPKYDLHIPNYENFALKCGVFSHNSQTADLTGGVLFDIQRYIEQEQLRTLIVMYVHDSIEVDVYPFELIKVISKLKSLLIESPQQRAGLPAKADVALGYSIGHEIEMEELETNNDYTACDITLKGYKDEIEDTINNWKTVYKTVDVLEENYKDIFVSVSDLFIKKKAYTPTIGTHRGKGICKVHIDYYN